MFQTSLKVIQGLLRQALVHKRVVVTTSVNSTDKAAKHTTD